MGSTRCIVYSVCDSSSIFASWMRLAVFSSLKRFFPTQQLSAASLSCALQLMHAICGGSFDR